MGSPTGASPSAASVASRERLPTSLAMRDLPKRFALLAYRANRSDGIAEGHNRQHVHVVRDAEQGFDGLKDVEADPVRGHPYDQTASTMDWISRLASETAKMLSVVATTMACRAWAI